MTSPRMLSTPLLVVALTTLTMPMDTAQDKYVKVNVSTEHRNLIGTKKSFCESLCHSLFEKCRSLFGSKSSKKEKMTQVEASNAAFNATGKFWM